MKMDLEEVKPRTVREKRTEEVVTDLCMPCLLYTSRCV